MTGPPHGASEAEVAELGAALKTALPLAYVQFLLWIGKDHHGIYKGTDIFINNVIENTKALPDLLSENSVREPQTRWLCFQSHQGYFMAWFALPPESDDPPVFYFGEGQGMTEPRFGGPFTQYVAAELADLSAIGGTARSDKPSILSRVKTWLHRTRSAPSNSG